MEDRIQKVFSARGICSRRLAEQYIEQGRVSVNGSVAGLGDRCDPDRDSITLDGKPVLERLPDKVYLMLNKPRGYVTTLSDEAGRPTVLDLLKGVDERVFPVGRLDMHSEGLLLLTNDGDLANGLTHPSHQVYKQYLLRASVDESGPEPPEVRLTRPMELDGRKLAPVKCRLVRRLEDETTIMTISIREGRNRQIRRMCTICGLTVMSLKRVAEGRLLLGDLPVGQYRFLTQEEVAYLKSLTKKVGQAR